MPRTPSWLERFADVEAIQDESIDRATVERVLGVSPRRAQQIMEAIPGRMVGTSKLVGRTALLDHLRALAKGEASEPEISRRRRMADWIEQQRRERIAHPRVDIEAPVAVVSTQLADLPTGISLEPGRISISFDTAQQALERLLALAMAIGNQFDQFEKIVRKP